MKILLFGKDGQVGWELQRSLCMLGELTAMGRSEADFNDLASLQDCVLQNKPDIIVNAAAYTAVDKAEAEPDIAHRVNAEAVSVIAKATHQLDALLVHYSTDYVFDGNKSAPYTETDAPSPLSVYGSSKLAGENAVRTGNARHLIFRTSWVYGVHGRNFPNTMLKLAREKRELKVVDDQYGAPTSAELIADVTAQVLFYLMRQQSTEKPVGTYHLAASGDTTWYGFARYLLEQAEGMGMTFMTNIRKDLVAIPAQAYPTAARRPANSRLDTAKLTGTFDIRLPDWQYHVQRLVAELITQGAQ